MAACRLGAALAASPNTSVDWVLLPEMTLTRWQPLAE